MTATLERPPTPTPSGGGARNRRTLGLIIKREVRTRLLSKAFAVSIGITLLFTVGLMAAIGFFGDDEPSVIGLVGEQPAGVEIGLADRAEIADVEIDIVTFADRAEAEAALEAGDADLVVIDGQVALLDQVSPFLVSLVSPVYQQASLVEGLAAEGLDDGQIGQALGQAGPLVVEELNPDPDSDSREGVAFFIVIMMFVAIQLSGAYIMLGVFEEKSSKVVELVLASVRARDLLLGKIIAVGLLGVLQILLLTAAALAGAFLFLDEGLPELSVGLVATGLVWFVIGYLLYGAMFAAGASLAPSQEDAQATLAPVSVIFTISYLTAIFAGSDPGSLFARVAGWVPTTAPFLMPGRLATGEAVWWEVAGSMALTALTAAAVLWLADRIYVRSVIHTDRKLGWREAFNLQS
jgi:ABC-2 type transport system permease protein